MPTDGRYASDVEEILSHRHDNGADLWATPDRRLLKGSPFSSLESPLYLLELGMEPAQPVLRETAEKHDARSCRVQGVGQTALRGSIRSRVLPRWSFSTSRS